MRSSLALALVLVLVTGAHAGEPTDQLRADIDELYRRAQQAPDGGGPEAAAILDRMFDWTRMAQTALRQHWRARTAAEQAEFTRVFAEVFRRAYLTRINLVDASKFQYLGDSVEGDRGAVKTTVATKRGSSLAVDYTVRRAEGGRWRVEDVRVERMSLIDNYRTQFHAIITRSSYDELLLRLRERAAK